MALRGILKKVFTFETLVGDIRSAVIGSITGVVAAFFGSIIFANTRPAGARHALQKFRAPRRASCRPEAESDRAAIS